MPWLTDTPPENEADRDNLEVLYWITRAGVAEMYGEFQGDRPSFPPWAELSGDSQTLVEENVIDVVADGFHLRAMFAMWDGSDLREQLKTAAEDPDEDD